MVEKLGIMPDRSIGVPPGNTGIGGINEDVFDGAALSVTGIIIVSARLTPSSNKI